MYILMSSSFLVDTFRRMRSEHCMNIFYFKVCIAGKKQLPKNWKMLNCNSKSANNDGRLYYKTNCFSKGWYSKPRQNFWKISLPSFKVQHRCWMFRQNDANKVDLFCVIQSYKTRKYFFLNYLFVFQTYRPIGKLAQTLAWNREIRRNVVWR